MKTIYLHIIIGAAALLTGACGTGTYRGTPWNLHDTEVVLRCGEVFEMPFKGGSTDYTIHNSHHRQSASRTINRHGKW